MRFRVKRHRVPLLDGTRWLDSTILKSSPISNSRESGFSSTACSRGFQPSWPLHSQPADCRPSLFSPDPVCAATTACGAPIKQTAGMICIDTISLPSPTWRVSAFQPLSATALNHSATNSSTGAASATVNHQRSIEPSLLQMGETFPRRPFAVQNPCSEIFQLLCHTWNAFQHQIR